MSFPNPFVRGFWGLHVLRSLDVICNGRSTWLPLHSSHERLPDDEVVQKPCLICNGHVISGTTETLATNLTADCKLYGYEKGFVTNVRYTILADENDRNIRLGDVPSLEEADEIIRRLTFRPGFFNRCWEISALHLEKTAVDYLEKIIEAAEALDFFSVFRIERHRIGIHLFNVDWGHAYSQHANDINITERLLGHLETGMPLSLARMLFLAGEADVQYLILAHGAPVLRGLPVFGR
jgi:hypothetical protein